MQVIRLVIITKCSSRQKITTTTRAMAIVLLIGKEDGGTRAAHMLILMVCIWGLGKHTTVEIIGVIGKRTR